MNKSMWSIQLIICFFLTLVYGSFFFTVKSSFSEHFIKRVSSGEHRGPGQNQLIIKTSDNENFEDHGEVIVEGGHVANLLESGEKVFLYFQWFPKGPSKKNWFDHIGVSISQNSGVNWTEPIAVNILGIPRILLGRNGRPMDPAAVNVPNGKIRLFFTIEKFQPHDRIVGDAKIHSAISSDGINFSYEPGPRFEIKDTDARDPAVVYFKNKWHLYVPDQKQEGTGYYATSSDGLKFVRENNVKVYERGDWLGNATTYDEKIVFFGTVWVGYSSNGSEWNSSRSRGLGPDPGAIYLRNGSWLGVTFQRMD